MTRLASRSAIASMLPGIQKLLEMQQILKSFAMLKIIIIIIIFSILKKIRMKKSMHKKSEYEWSFLVVLLRSTSKFKKLTIGIFFLHLLDVGIIYVLKTINTTVFFFYDE